VEGPISGHYIYERIRIMASATWLRLLKLEFARVVSNKAASHKQRRRGLRPRLAAEQLEDRTMPSGGGIHLSGPGGNQPPAPQPQGPTVQAPPPHLDHGPGQNNPPGLAPNGPGNGKGRGDGNDNGGPGQGNPPPGLAANGPGNGKGRGDGNDNGPGQDNPPPGPMANGRGNGNGQGEGDTNAPGAGNQPESPPIPAGTGFENDYGHGNENGGAPLRPFSSLSALGSSGFEASPAEAVGEPNSFGALADTLSTIESNALVGFAKATSPFNAPAESPGTGSPSGSEEESGASMPGYNSGSASSGTPLLIATFPNASGAFAPVVMGLSSPPSGDSIRAPAIYNQISDLDRLFLDLWDDDQLLFPDTLPSIDEMLFPDSMPKLDDMLLPSASPWEDAPLLNPDQRSQAPVVVPAAVGMEDAPVFAAPVLANGDSIGIPSLILIPSPARAAPAPVASDAHRLAPISQPTTANGWQEDALGIPTSEEEPASGDDLRPYRIALGMIPCLVAFGYTPSRLREHVQAGRQAWKRLRSHRHRKPSK
jgi:hypothetical protein